MHVELSLDLLGKPTSVSPTALILSDERSCFQGDVYFACCCDCQKHPFREIIIILTFQVFSVTA